MTKSAHFFPVKISFSAEKYAKIYIWEMVRLHGVFHFLRLWNSLYILVLEVVSKGLRTQVKLSTNFHPQTDRQAEHTIQTLEDMLRACVIDFKVDGMIICL
uniref:Putative ovule protein n=1 Tax=Solanum chacoense TaxID=4108 RepID=A0A0V0HZD4_SOLCH